MPNRLAPCFIANYTGLYEILHKPHPNMYTLKLLANFVAHLTFHVSKLKLFLHDEQRLDQKQRVLMPLNISLLLKSKAYLCEVNTPHKQRIFGEIQRFPS